LVKALAKNEYKISGHGNQKSYEDAFVAGANAIIDPRTMMVKVLHATIANITMFTFFRPDNFATRAQIGAIMV